ncbi:glycosyltransferase [Metabacillus litoralis]|uniref:Glycosyltransferase n=1 Tax=Metabacillus litoralis TaxID=152268 RepID=A0A5C6W4R0_9BACI|nr:glycosyltransferase [Metabacillus litoralis]TXC92365.1 glycosyltransferase [Metabacillus litoralis]
MSVKVSVIIPVYNAEKYIAHCIESLIAQTLVECEFIFVNDGSTDKSKEVIESYQAVDPRIKLINQDNKGVSFARNMGLEVAVGEYVGFVDADDYIEKEMYQVLYQSVKLHNCDAIISNIASEMNGKRNVVCYPFPHEIKLEKDNIENKLLPYLLEYDNLNTVVNKLFSRRIITDYQVGFPNKVSLGEDGMFNIRFFCYANSFIYIKYSGYHYREVIGSATRNISQKDYFHRVLEVYKSDVPEVKEIISSEKLKQLKSVKLIKNVLSYIHVYFTPTDQVNFYKRYIYVRNMVHNRNVREALSVYISLHNRLGRYENILIHLIKFKVTLGLYFIVGYSRFRNKGV